MKYLSECDLIIYDLHAGNPQDVRLALEALKNTKFEEPPDKTLILVSSLMAWSGTDKNKEEIKSAEQLAEEEAAKKAAEQADGDGEPKGSQDGSQAGDPETPPEAEDPEEP
jgi:UDP-N-acetylmuramyl pentapeptide synthase